CPARGWPRGGRDARRRGARASPPRARAPRAVRPAPPRGRGACPRRAPGAARECALRPDWWTRAPRRVRALARIQGRRVRAAGPSRGRPELLAYDAAEDAAVARALEGGHDFAHHGANLRGASGDGRADRSADFIVRGRGGEVGLERLRLPPLGRRLFGATALLEHLH